jgi:hypothetical protein
MCVDSYLDAIDSTDYGASTRVDGGVGGNVMVHVIACSISRVRGLYIRLAPSMVRHHTALSPRIVRHALYG